MLKVVNAEVAECRLCPRLVEWRERVGVEKKRAFREWDYWARPVPGFGDPAARLLVLGLAPAAHGANRTGRMFTGDRSGDWLFAALHRAGFANQPTSAHRDDGLALTGAYVTSAVKCAPPDNKPLPGERDACFAFIRRELALLTELRAVLCLGGFAWEQAIRVLRDAGYAIPTPLPKFGHGATARVEPGLTLIGSYHPSQQNTFTGRLTEAMLDDVMALARRAIV
ncbi:MAG TPA: uracil-DNA glycosylase [Longimicrobiaceae bacterium]|jgi:uracil-DNA glycosylase family 4|nr:uracil-DNA glycosylase [Longimicrobiaceae bacterium]